MHSTYFRGRAESPAGAPPSAPPFSLSIPAIDNTYGAILLGTFLGLILYGVMLIQVYWYVRRQFADSLYTKSYVAFLAVIGTFFTIQTIYTSYWYLVTNYFAPLRLFTGVWSINLLPVSMGVAVTACQWRVACFGFCRSSSPDYRTASMHVASTSAFLFMAELGMITPKASAEVVTSDDDMSYRLRYIVSNLQYILLPPPHISLFGTVSFVLPSLLQYRNYAWTDSAGFAFAVGADTIMTTVLVIYLHRSRTGFRHTNSTIDALIAYTVTTGLLIDLVSVVSMVSAWVMPDNLIYVGCNIVSTHLYVNCVLGTLNSRQPQSEPRNGSERAGLIHLPSLAKRGNTSTGSDSVMTRSEEKPLDVLHIRAAGDHTQEQQHALGNPIQAVRYEIV
ncbi:hypothetical protein VTO73DRAFT_8755 [Trametes versicolor]